MHRFYLPMLAAFSLALAAGCGGKQSYADAVKIMCHAPHKAGLDKVAPEVRQQTLAKWVNKRLKNDRARSLFATYENGSPWARRRLLRKATREAGITSCALADLGSRLRPELAERLAEVPATHFTELTDEAPRVLVTRREIIVDGTKVLSLRNGVIEKDGVADVGSGRIEALTTALAALTYEGAAQTTTRALVVYFDRDTPFQLVLRVLSSALVAPANFSSLRLLVRAGDATRALALAPPPWAPNTAPATLATRNDGGVTQMTRPTDHAPEAIHLVISLSTSQIIIWSMSGSAGTRGAPAFEAPVDPNRAKRPASFDAPAVSRALAKIVALHWKDKPRLDGDRQLMLLVDGNVPFHVVARAAAAAKGPRDKPALFDGVRFGAALR